MNNSQALSADSHYCDKLQNTLNLTASQSPFFDGKQCHDLPKYSLKISGFLAIFAILNTF
ncbi:uncharacterized protein CELE_Y38C9B.3 [Caenorhabditis elegans]|nr:Uncharacterized protein CELE_Y38C9B.3 [Caenorhabditis elegans]CAH2188531.1 Uncharacterized protein CELE_Y38C9B.3 [Caenorhabditis elegans]